MKKFYKNFRSHIWLFVLTLLFSAVFSIWVLNAQTPLTWGIGMFIFGIVLLYAGIKLTPLDARGGKWTCYNWEWLVCVILATALWIFLGLRMPNHARTLILVVGVLAWYLVVWLFGLFFINTIGMIDESLDDYE